jgi:hypothetical protein
MPLGLRSGRWRSGGGGPDRIADKLQTAVNISLRASCTAFSRRRLSPSARLVIAPLLLRYSPAVRLRRSRWKRPSVCSSCWSPAMFSGRKFSMNVVRRLGVRWWTPFPLPSMVASTSAARRAVSTRKEATLSRMNVSRSACMRQVASSAMRRRTCHDVPCALCPRWN